MHEHTPTQRHTHSVRTQAHTEYTCTCTNTQSVSHRAHMYTQSLPHTQSTHVHTISHTVHTYMHTNTQYFIHTHLVTHTVCRHRNTHTGYTPTDKHKGHPQRTHMQSAHTLVHTHTHIHAEYTHTHVSTCLLPCHFTVSKIVSSFSQKLIKLKFLGHHQCSCQLASKHLVCCQPPPQHHHLIKKCQFFFFLSSCNPIIAISPG